METAMIEAVRAAAATNMATAAVPGVTPVADPNAVNAFQAAMAAPVTDIPFVQQASAAWRAGQDVYQEGLHRMTALSEMTKLGQVSAAQMTELQYQLMNINFNLEVVTSVAKKSSDAVSTLVKNG